MFCLIQLIQEMVIFTQADFNDKDTFYIFNHVDITIFYHKVENEAAGARLVAAKLEPKRYLRLYRKFQLIIWQQRRALFSHLRLNKKHINIFNCQIEDNDRMFMLICTYGVCFSFFLKL